MRWRLLTFFLAIAAALAAVQIVEPKVISSRTRVAATVESILCPSSTGSATMVIGGKGTIISPVDKAPSTAKERAYTTASDVTKMQISAKAHLVEKASGAITQIDTSGGLAGLACPSADTSYWFVGGSAALASQDSLIMTNDGHGDATVSVLAWSDKGPAPAFPVVVPARSSIQVGLDSVAPGINAIVLHVLVRSGRVAISLYDRRSQGLSGLGADFVSPGNDPAKEAVILGVPGTIAESSAGTKTKKSAAKSAKPAATDSNSRTLRLLSPDSDATVRVDVVGASDSFTPIGLDNIQLKAGKVREIQVNADLISLAYAFLVHSDVPVVAGVLSSSVTGKARDISWSASGQNLNAVTSSADSAGTSYVFFSQTDASVEITKRTADGLTATSTLRLPAASVVVWPLAIPSGQVGGVTFVVSSARVFAARVLTNTSGITTSPLRSLSMSRGAIVPLADVGVGMPR